MVSICPACQAENPVGAPYCARCAAELGHLCPTCGYVNPFGHRFCGQCGTRLEDSPTSNGRGALTLQAQAPPGAQGPEGQRRDVTILIADLSNYTATVHALDPEDAYTLVADYLGTLSRIVLEYDGTVHKYTGDGIIALFGAPEAHEDDPERALRAALDMQGSMRKFTPKLNAQFVSDLRIRIGVHIGTVIVGALGPDGAQDYTVVGDTVNLASRLESAALPGTILVSAPIYQRTRPLFDFEPQPPLSLKGVPELFEAYRLVGARVRPGRVRGVPGLQAPLIGRDRPYEQLRAALAMLTQRKQGRVVFISGEAGVGKTRLVTELRSSAAPLSQMGEGLGVRAEPEVTWLEGRCVPYGRTQAYAPFAQALSTGLGITAADDETERLAKIERALERRGGAAGRALAPYFAFLLSAGPSGGALPDRISHLGPLAAQQETFAAVRQFLQWETAQRPVVLLLDDLHWSDELSRELLISLLDLSERIPILLCCIGREEGEAGHLDIIRRAAQARVPDHVTSIGLEPLSDDDCGRLIDHLLGNPDLPRALRQGIIARALGNPFFVEEIIRMLIDRGQLVQAASPGEGWTLAPGAPPTIAGVPGTLSALILTRFDRLPQPLQATLQAAAVLGSRFAYAELSAMLRLPEAELRRHLAELVTREFMVDIRAVAGEDAYAFRHPLTQEAVYSTLLKRRRRELHRAAGEAIERLYAGRLEAQAENLARHFEVCERPDKAGPYLLIAAERAAARYATDQAIAYFERARQAAASHEQWAASSDLLRIASGLGTVYQFVGRYVEALREMQAALDLIPSLPEGPTRQIEQARLMSRVAAIHDRLGEFQEAITWYERANESILPRREASRIIRAQVAFGLGETYFYLGQYDLAQRYVRHSLGLVAGTNLYAEQATAYNLLGGICFRTGDRAGALDYTRRALALREAIGHTSGIAHSTISLGILQWIQGQRSEAIRSLERAVHLCQDIGDARGLCSALDNLGVCYLRLGQIDQALAYLQRVLALTRRMMDVPESIRTQLNLGHAYLEAGELTQAETVLTEALHLAEEVSGQEYLAEAYELIARLHLGRSEVEAAMTAAGRALELALQMGRADYQANAYRTLATAHRLRGDWARAEAALAQSLDACDQMGDPHLLALTLREQGRLLLDQAQRAAELGSGDPVLLRAQAREKLEIARDLFARLESSRALQEVQAMLRSLRQADRAAQYATSGEDRADEPRWREAAVLAVRLDLVRNSEAASDPELRYELLQEALPILLAAVARFEGTAQVRGDGFDLVFGAPVAQEDAPERALRAGLAVQAALNDLNRRFAEHHDGATDCPPGLAARQAIAGGQVVVDGQVVAGAALRIADDLAQMAAAGEILVTEAVRDHTARAFDFDAVAAGYHLIGPRRIAQWHGFATTDRVAPLIGREPELAALRRVLSAAQDQRAGHVVIIQGEAGIGKSRLMAEALSDANAHKVVASYAHTHTQAIAYGGLAELARGLLGVAPDTSEAEIRRRLSTALSAEASESVAEGLLHLLEQHGPQSPGPLARLDAAQLRQQMFIALRLLLLAEASRQPLVLVFEDIHWLDAASLDALYFLLGLVEQAPLFICCLMRVEEPGRHSRLVNVAQRLCPGRVLTLTLGPLEPEQADKLIGLLGGEELEPALRRQITSRAEGNPLFLQELVTLAITQHGQRISVPRSVSALVLSRLDHLPAQQQRLAQAAAVLGRSFDARLLEQMTGEEVLEADLEALRDHGLIRPAGMPGRYEFRHGLMQEAIYQALSKRRRAQWHRLAGEVLERLAGDQPESQAETLAYHFVQADLPAKALPYLLMAGQKAAETYANEAAVAAFGQAKALLPRLPEATAADRWTLYIGLSDALTAIGDYRAALAELQTVQTSGLMDAIAPHLRAGLHRRLARNAERTGDIERALAELDAARTCLGDADDANDASRLERAQIELTLGWMLFRRSQTEAAQGAGTAALDAGEELANFGVIAAACNLLGGIAYTTGDLEQAIALSERSLALRREIGDTLGAAAAYSNLGVLAVAQGQWDQAIQHFERALAMRREAGDLAGAAVVLSNMGQIAKDRGDLERAEENFSASLCAAERAENVYQQIVNRSNLGHLKVLQGDAAGAVQMLTESIRRAEAIGARDLVAEAQWMVAEAWLELGDIAAAEAAATQALALAAEIDHWRHAAHARRMLGRAAMRSKRCLEAAAHLRAALRIARQLGDRLALAMVYEEWADLRARSGRPERAQPWRQRAHELYGGLKPRL